MNLMTFVRLVVLLVIAGTVLSLSAGVLGVGGHESSASTFFVPRPSLHDAVPVSRPEDPSDPVYRLLDQTSGQTESLPLPVRESWSLLSVSPWRDRDGNLQAAGRWVRRREGENEFCGIGFLTLPDSTVRNRVTLDVLPIGKLYWVHDRPGVVLFPAGDGRLYRCKITDPDDEKTLDDSRPGFLKNEENVLKARPVAWEAASAGFSAAYLSDPAGSSEPRFGHLVFVSLSPKILRKGRPVILPSKLWWLVMNDEGDAIVNAGRLTIPGPEEMQSDTSFERMPTVVTGAGGEISLVYLTRCAPERLWQLKSAKLEIDAETALPRMLSPALGSNVLATDLAPSPLVVSASGMHVFALDGAGRVVTHSIPR
jgi:hypothetical protein